MKGKRTSGGQSRSLAMRAWSPRAQKFGSSACVFFKISIGAEREHLRGLYVANQMEADGTTALSALREACAPDQRGNVHQPMRAVFDPVDAAFRHTITWLVILVLHWIFACTLSLVKSELHP
jgi:hypothetical protein